MFSFDFFEVLETPFYRTVWKKPYKHISRSKMFLLYFYDACDVVKKISAASTGCSCRTNVFIKFHHLMKKKKKIDTVEDQTTQVNFL